MSAVRAKEESAQNELAEMKEQLGSTLKKVDTLFEMLTRQHQPPPP